MKTTSMHEKRKLDHLRIEMHAKTTGIVWAQLCDRELAASIAKELGKCCETDHAIGWRGVHDEQRVRSAFFLASLGRQIVRPS